MGKNELTDYERGIFANVEKHGWHSVHVFDPEGVAPGFSYSVGFPKTLAAPEFIVFGLPSKLMHNMLWGVFEQIKSGTQAEHGRRWSDLIEGFDCVSLIADHDHLFSEYLISSKWFWTQTGHTGVPPVMQLVWPGKLGGLFPWDPGCSELVMDVQPKLWTLPPT